MALGKPGEVIVEAWDVASRTRQCNRVFGVKWGSLWGGEESRAGLREWRHQLEDVCFPCTTMNCVREYFVHIIQHCVSA